MDFNRCYGCMEALARPGSACARCGYDNTKAASSQPAYALSCGTVLAGRYVIGRVLGQGGFGMTYIAWNQSLEIPVCIKEYFPSAAQRDQGKTGAVVWSSGGDAEELKRGRESFVKEARKAAKLMDLDSIVKVWDVFYQNETAYIVMNYIAGKTLKTHLQERGAPLGEEECFRLLEPVMRDLEKVHARGIIHRDIKPDNLMLCPDGRLMLLDLGAAKDLSGGSGQSSYMVASRGFSPMEQYTAHGEIGPWTDVYALCATMYYCMTGKLLPSPMDRMCGSELELSGLSPRLAAVMEKGVAIMSGDRYRSVAELLAALEEVFSLRPDAEEQARRRQEEKERREFEEWKRRKHEEERREREEQERREREEQERREREEQERREREEQERREREEQERRKREEQAAQATPQPQRKPSGEKGGRRLLIPLLLAAAALVAVLIWQPWKSPAVPAPATPTPTVPTPTPTAASTPAPTSVPVPATLSYEVHDSFVTITGCDPSVTAVEIPAEIEGRPVTEIGSRAFYAFSSLRTVTLPDSVTSIGRYAFINCTSLTGVTLPDSVTSIGNAAFYNCTSLTSVIIPDSVTSIGDNAFKDCTSLTGVTIPNSVTSIGKLAFTDCTSLTSITIPDGVTSIGKYAFSDCTSLTSITIPGSVTSIDNSAFDGCSALTAIQAPAGSYTAQVFAGDSRLVIR